jgi:hypothetical protein
MALTPLARFVVKQIPKKKPLKQANNYYQVTIVPVPSKAMEKSH